MLNQQPFTIQFRAFFFFCFLECQLQYYKMSLPYILHHFPKKQHKLSMQKVKAII